MDKKDIYEHLAKIYLDASLNKKKKSIRRSKIFQNILLGVSFFVLAFGLGIYANLHKAKPLFKSELALILLTDAVKINFNFDPAKKEIYALNLNSLDLARYRTLAFTVKNANFRDTISLRVEFVNAFKEKSEVYVKNIPHRWQDFKIGFGEFRNISDWSEMLSLVFSVEEWNAQSKKGVVYLDNIRLLK
jgi:hypothetical protein